MNKEEEEEEWKLKKKKKKMKKRNAAFREFDDFRIFRKRHRTSMPIVASAFREANDRKHRIATISRLDQIAVPNLC